MTMHTRSFQLARLTGIGMAAALAIGLCFASASEVAAQESREVVIGSQDPGELTRREMFTEIRSLLEEVAELRKQLAAAQLEVTAAQRDLDELRQFIADHHEYGDDFSQYKAVREAAEAEARRKVAEANRQRAEEAKAKRRERFEEAREQREKERAESARVNRYRRAGFSPLGLDVLISKVGFHYGTEGVTRQELNYHPLIGFDYVPVQDEQIDFTKMTISGSVVNASKQTRNIGVALTFFDENGNQVGAETIQINNARPDVPYPFTSTIDMALNRGFASTSQYVLYADPVAAPGGGGGGGGGGGAGGDGGAGGYSFNWSESHSRSSSSGRSAGTRR